MRPVPERIRRADLLPDVFYTAGKTGYFFPASLRTECMLLVSARCRVHPEHCRDFIDQVNRIIPLVRAEPGCMRYELHTDVFEQGLFVFCEEWESQKHLDDHIATPHLQDHFATCGGWMAAPTELTVYEVSGHRTVVLS